MGGTEKAGPRLKEGAPARSSEGRVELAHGAGGRAMSRLIEDVFLAELGNEWLLRGNDQAVFESPRGRLAFTTDGFVVSPLFFPGGDIGRLAVNGTVNDLAMSGARPLHLAAGFILEEGFPIADLRRIARSMAEAAREAGVAVVTGDTKVVERNKGDGVFITTTGLGLVPEGARISGDRARPGDAVLVSGTLGDHGVVVLSKRNGLGFETELLSDTAPLHGLVARMLEAAPDIHSLRDPTRGGLAATLNELCWQSGVGMLLNEGDIPVLEAVQAACEMLGLDPLHVANEGKLVAVCAPRDAPGLLAAMRSHPLGAKAAIIGSVREDSDRLVRMRTALGGARILPWIEGEQLPRIC